MSVNRFAVAKLDSKELKLDANGFLRVKAFATRTGVFKYTKADGTVYRELRHPDEVFHADSLASMHDIPVTNNHPKEKLVDSKNAKALMVGYTSKAVPEGQFIATSLTVTDADAIQDIQAGKQECSSGYQCELDETPGEYEGERYDAIQRNIRYNHVAIVDRGRAGPRVRLNLDAADAVEEGIETIKEVPQMKKIKIDGKEFEVADEVAAAYEAEQTKTSAKIDAANDAAKAAKDAASEASKKLDGEKARADSAEAKLKERGDGVAQLPTLVKARVALESVASKVVDKDTKAKLDTLDDKAVKVAVIKSIRKDFDEAGKSEAYIDAAFDIAKADIATAEKDGKDLGDILVKKDGDEGTGGETRTDSEKARQKAEKEADEAWKQPLSSSKKQES